jgi:diadenosine tetraphosphate (Ap4A) HIT family hydrolase
LARCEQKRLQKNDNIFEYVEHKQSGKGGIKVITEQHSSELKDLRADACEGI